jgi:RNA polymerase sigma-70 factor (ECF subfamily)
MYSLETAAGEQEESPELWKRAAIAGASRWPGVRVDPDRLAAWLDERGDTPEQIEELHLADLYFACALHDRDPGALRIFDRELGSDVEAAARAAGADPATAAEVRQQIAADVLVGDDGVPRITQYAGRGDLRGWLRSVAVRATWKLVARARRDRPLDEDLAGALAVDDDAQLAALRERYATELARAIAEAMRTLTARQRTILRLAYLDHVPPDVLGRMYAVHRATAARWVVSAREALFDAARVRLQAAVDAGLTSVVRLVQSQLEQGLAGLIPP